jgi:hypothetical protein
LEPRERPERDKLQYLPAAYASNALVVGRSSIVILPDLDSMTAEHCAVLTLDNG